MFESDRYKHRTGSLTAKTEKVAKARAQKLHEQDTQARLGDVIYDEHGNAVSQQILGPLTKKGVMAGRHIDIHGRGAELRNMQSQTQTNNRFLDTEARARANAGGNQNFVVGGLHQWSQNLAYDPVQSGTAAGRTRPGGPGATGGPPPAGLAGTPYSPGGAGHAPGGTSPGAPGGGAHAPTPTYPMEFQKRPIDFEGAHESSRGLFKVVTLAGRTGQRLGNWQDRREQRADELRGFTRPVIGYHPVGQI